MLAWVAAQTERIDVGAAVFQIPARTPAMTAMTAATLDTLSGGRFRLGLGVSGPQVSEGWHGVRFDKPLARTREYVDIVRLALRRETVRVRRASTSRCRCPTARARRCKLTVHPVREHVPIYLAAVGPKNLELAGEIADGWLAIFFSPEHAERVAGAASRPAASARPGADDRTASTSSPTVPVVDRRRRRRPAPTPIRPYAALYVGGMGSREQNFYNALAVRMGYERRGRARCRTSTWTASTARRWPPCRSSFIDQTSLLGPRERVARPAARVRRGRASTTLTVAPFARRPRPADRRRCARWPRLSTSPVWAD